MHLRIDRFSNCDGLSYTASERDQELIHIPQTNIGHREKETQYTDSHTTARTQ